jgi:hypothetical protein
MRKRVKMGMSVVRIQATGQALKEGLSFQAMMGYRMHIL